MAQNVVIAGASFSNVPAIRVPDENNVYHPFVDPSPTTATDSDVASGKIYFKADGTQSTGTASGGSATIISKTITTNGTYNASSDSADGYDPVIVNVSGGGGLFGTFLKTESLGHVQSTSSTAADVKTITVNNVNSYDALCVVAKAENVRNSYLVCTVNIVPLLGTSDVSIKGSVASSMVINYRKINDIVQSKYRSASCGIYVNISTSSVSGGTATLNIKVSYNTTYTAAINDDFTAYIYGINLYDTVINN